MTVEAGEQDAPAASGSRRSWRRTATLVVLLLVVGFAVGALWQRHHAVGSATPREVTGTASLRGEADTGFTVLFQGDDGSSTSVSVDDVAWISRNGNTEGQGGVPPCMKPGRDLRTTAGVVDVSTGETGGYLYLAWLRCP